MPLPQPAHGTANRWRLGCRCAPCSDAHLGDLAAWRHRRRERKFPSATRNTLLARIAAGEHLTDVGRDLDIPQQLIHTYAWMDQAWGKQLDDALMAGRDPEVTHGTEGGYRHGRCRCPECRDAHNASRGIRA